MPRKLQFSLASLLVATAVVAIALNWWTLRERMIAARQGFIDAEKEFVSGKGTIDGLRGASSRLLQAELRLPFTSDRSAWMSHLERTRGLERRSRGFAVAGSFPSIEWIQKLERIHDELRKECEAIELRLGLPTTDR